MLSCTEFIPCYSELFTFLEAKRGREELNRFWDYPVRAHRLRHPAYQLCKGTGDPWLLFLLGWHVERGSCRFHHVPERERRLVYERNASLSF